MKVHGVDLIPEGDRVVIADKKPGGFEPESMALWLSCATAGRLLLDVGAYSGVYAIAAAQRGARVAAFEPNPVVFGRLKNNVVRNRVKVECYSQAVSDREEQRNLWTKHDMTSAGRFKKRVDGTATMVDCVSLDSLKICAGDVAAVKIDVEGAELAVMHGAARMLQRAHPVVIAEALTEDKAAKMREFMATLGYSSFIADRRNLVFIA